MPELLQPGTSSTPPQAPVAEAADADAGAGAWGLQQRLRRQLLAWIGGLWLVGAAAAMAGIWHEATETLNSALEETAQMLLSAPAGLFASDGDPPAGHGPHEEYVVYQVFDAQGAMRLRSHSAPLQAMDPNPQDGVRDVGPWHVLTLNSTTGERRVQVAETREHRREVLLASASWLALALVLVLVLAAIAIRVLLTRAFATLEPARQDLSQRLPHELHPLDVSDLPIELRPWMETVNALMARVQSTVNAERAFSAHTAHELRTPLAAARAQAQRLALSSGDPAEREHVQALVRQLDRITHLATRLLQLARIESGVALQREPVDLHELATMVADEFAEARRQGRLHIEVQGDHEPIQGDIDALGIALRNLIDNALKHGGDSADVTLQVEPLALTVIDTGPGVSADHLPRLGHKFARANSGAEGAGLGLAMVRTIAEQSDALLELNSPVRGGRGFRATIRFARLAS
jgi:two-component system OmpR family sensor kinase